MQFLKSVIFSRPNLINFLVGYGYLTIKLKNIRAFGLVDGSSCDVSAASVCDPYVKLFINGEKVIQTQARDDICCFDANVTYQSTKISKTSTIKIELWDDDSGFFGNPDDLILESAGSVEAFVKTPIRDGAVIDSHQNLIETTSFWQDEME